MRTIYYRLKLCEQKTEGMPDNDENAAIWDEVHKLNAREMREHAEDAKGLFIKAGQFMTSQAGVLPDVYPDELMCLTDHLPVSTIQEVHRVIRRDLGKPPLDFFQSIEPEPIASASIAQVHRAYLRNSGELVAVKVQHDGVDRVFIEDVGTLSMIADQVAYWMPELDFRKFAEEWRESLPRELDFREERRALERAAKVFKRVGSKVRVPRPHPKLTGRHVLVMDYIDAIPIMKIADAEFCDQNGIDKNQVLETLLEAFATCVFQEGIFHADPHAGNIRIVLDEKAPGGAQPVLFDWGLFREITRAQSCP